MRKKAEKKVEYEEIAVEYADDCCKAKIPEGATHYTFEIDTTGCYYECDMPSYKMHFFKVKQ